MSCLLAAHNTGSDPGNLVKFHKAFPFPVKTKSSFYLFVWADSSAHSITTSSTGSSTKPFSRQKSWILLSLGSKWMTSCSAPLSAASAAAWLRARDSFSFWFSPEAAMAVSYTHLDVYKRQSSTSSSVRTEASSINCRSSSSLLHISSPHFCWGKYTAFLSLRTVFVRNYRFSTETFAPLPESFLLWDIPFPFDMLNSQTSVNLSPDFKCFYQIEDKMSPAALYCSQRPYFTSNTKGDAPMKKAVIYARYSSDMPVSYTHLNENMVY